MRNRSGLKKFIALSILLLSCIWGITAAAQTGSTIVLTDAQEQYPVGMHMQILEDKEKQWTIEDVTSPEIAAQFIPSLETAPGFGFADSAYWVRFQVRNEASPDTDWLLLYDAAAFFIDYYLPSASGDGYDVIQTGSALPFSTRDTPVGEFVF